MFCNIDVEFWKEFFNIYIRVKAFDDQDRISTIELDNMNLYNVQGLEK